MATLPSLTSSFSLLQKQTPAATPIGGTQTSTPATKTPGINWGAINVQPAPTFGMKAPTSAPAKPVISASPMSGSTPAMASTFASATPVNAFTNPNPPMPNMATTAQNSPTPAMPSVAPSTYKAAEPVQTFSGLTANPDTGAIVEPAGVQTNTANTGNYGSTANYSSAAGGAPAMPYTGDGSYDPSITSPEAEDLFKKYKATLEPGADELAAEQNLNNLNVAAATAYTNTQNQPIALPFITGQQAAQQRSQTLLAAPLEQQIALAQAKRQTASTVSKAALDRLDAQAKAKRDMTAPVSVGSGSSLVDPITGKAIYTAPSAADTKAPTTIETENGIMQWDPAQKAWVTTGMAGTKVADKQQAAQASAQSATARANSLNTKIDEAIKNVGFLTSGPAGAISQNVPGTPAYNLAQTINTIKANLGFEQLQQMREQSPTGGALGAVSEMELKYLQSTVASLELGQSPEQLKANLAEIKTHFENWKNSVIQAAQTSGGTSSSSSGTGSGGQYDW